MLRIVEEWEHRKEAVLGNVQESELEFVDLLGDVDESQLNVRFVRDSQSADVQLGKTLGDVEEAEVCPILYRLDAIDKGGINAGRLSGVDVDEGAGETGRRAGDRRSARRDIPLEEARATEQRHVHGGRAGGRGADLRPGAGDLRFHHRQ